MNAPDPSRADALQVLRDMAAEAQAWKEAASGSVTDAVAAWLGPQYLLAAREKLAAADEAGRFEVLRTFLHDWAKLRRGDHAGARLQLEREELDWQRAASQAQKEKDFRDWVQRPEVRRELFPEHTGGLRPETLVKIERELNLL